MKDFADFIGGMMKGARKYLMPNTTSVVIWILMGLILTYNIGCEGGKWAWPGTTEDYVAQIEEVNTKLKSATDELSAVLTQRDVLQEALNKARADVETLLNAQGATQEEKDAAAKKFAEVEARFADINTAIDKAQATVNTLNAASTDLSKKLATAETPEEAIGATVGTVGSIVAPLTGPAAPIVLIISNLLNTILTSYGQRKRSTRQITQPLEVSRVPEKERELDPEGRYLVIDTAKSAKLHVEEGVAKDIRVATEKVHTAKTSPTAVPAAAASASV